MTNSVGVPAVGRWSREQERLIEGVAQINRGSHAAFQPSGRHNGINPALGVAKVAADGKRNADDTVVVREGRRPIEVDYRGVCGVLRDEGAGSGLVGGKSGHNWGSFLGGKEPSA